MPHIIDTTSPNYKAYKKIFMPGGSGQYNGAYYYSQEIVKNIIPNVKTDRPWDTLGMKALGSADRAIVFLHHNRRCEEVYGWLRKYKDLVYACSVFSPTYQWAMRQNNGIPICLPLSIDVEYVKQFKAEKAKKACYAGNLWKFKEKDIEKYVPKGTDFPPKNLPREELLKFIAPYETCYAIGRTAMEAQVLGCEVKNCDSRYDDTSWEVYDNKDAAKDLQRLLDIIDSPVIEA